MRITKCLIAGLLLCAAPGWASTLELYLDFPLQNANPGDAISFDGYMRNTSNAIVDLNGISITMGGTFTVDSNPFYDVTAPISIAVAPGATVTYTWFKILVENPYTLPYGVMTGTLSILGGIEGPRGYDPNTQDLLGSTSFSIDVSAPVGTPEPATWSMMLMGAALLVFRRRAATAARPLTRTRRPEGLFRVGGRLRRF